MSLSFQEGLARGETLAKAAQISAGLVAISSLLVAGGVALFLNDAWPHALIGTYDWHGLDVLILIDVALLVISFFLVGAWIYRAHANLQLLYGPEFEFTPGWAVGWFAIPFANFFKPFQAMKALWRVSHGHSAETEETAPGLLWFWWIAWVSTGVSGFSEALSGLDIFGGLANAVSAACLVVIIRQINAAQPGMLNTDTFE